MDAISPKVMLKYWIGRAWYRAFGWKFEGLTELPPKLVLIAAPHTSNWDLPFMLGAGWMLRINISWLGKHTLFEGMFGRFMKALGGIAVDRRKPQNLVQQVVDQINASSDMILAVPPEGTRRKVDYWKSGFYHIAASAGVPIGLSYLDYKGKRAGIGMLITPSGDIHADMEKIRAFYADKFGKFADHQGVPRLREEDDVKLKAADG